MTFLISLLFISFYITCTWTTDVSGIMSCLFEHLDFKYWSCFALHHQHSLICLHWLNYQNCQSSSTSKIVIAAIVTMAYVSLDRITSQNTDQKSVRWHSVEDQCNILKPLEQWLDTLRNRSIDLHKTEDLLHI